LEDGRDAAGSIAAAMLASRVTEEHPSLSVLVGRRRACLVSRREGYCFSKG